MKVAVIFIELSGMMGPNGGSGACAATKGPKMAGSTGAALTGTAGSSGTGPDGADGPIWAFLFDFNLLMSSDSIEDCVISS